MFRKISVLCAAIVFAMLPGAATAASNSLSTDVSIPVTVGAGATVAVTPAKASGKVTRTYQWFLSGSTIIGAKSAKYVTKTSQLGKRLKVRETVRFSNGKTQSSVSNEVVIGRVLVWTSPSISFSDDTMNAIASYLPTYSPASATVAYQWLRDGAAISGAIQSTYSTVVSDSGKQLSLRLTISKKGFRSATLTTDAVTAPVSDAGTTLLWSDEFNAAAGTAPDSTKWTPQNGDGVAFGNAGWGNGEKQWYLLENSRQNGEGQLEITATRTGADSYTCYYGTCSWLSSKIVTLNKVGFKYGRIAARIKVPAGGGTWPAFWTLGSDINTHPWPACGELDVMEAVGNSPRTLWGTAHGPLSGGGGRGGTKDLPAPLADGYHVYAMDWFADHLTWYVDGVPYFTYTKATAGADWVFDKENYLILNLAMGGGMGGAISPSLNSAVMSVDWVRAYSVDGVGEVITH